ncbi:MAG: NTP transferase domain-containing protein [Oxalobacteraceae bacterium]|nr:NTP transferase domain-containing protein [Oxalobacteraceae bacterium]
MPGPIVGILLAAERCEKVICQDADAGMGRSLAVGVRESDEAAAWVVAQADMGFILPSSHLSVAASLRAGAGDAVLPLARYLIDGDAACVPGRERCYCAVRPAG